jgi:hypothetical protein
MIGEIFCHVYLVLDGSITPLRMHQARQPTKEREQQYDVNDSLDFGNNNKAERLPFPYELRLPRILQVLMKHNLGGQN